MTNPFRQALEEESFDGSFASKIFRNSLLAAEHKFYPHRTSSLRVHISGDDVDAYTTSKVAMAVMDSASLFARSVVDPDSESVNKQASFRDSLGFRTLGATGSNVLLGFADPEPDDEQPLLDRRDTPSLAETAFRNLAEALPEDDEDDMALDAARSLYVPQRAGLSDLAEALEELNRKIALTLHISDGEAISGQLNVDQAEVLTTSLTRHKEHEWPETRYGVLDGMRTRRQRFFLDTEDGMDLWGAVDDRVLPQLPQYIGRHVGVRLMVSQTSYANGRSSRKAYRLVEIHPDQRNLQFTD